MHSYWVDQRCGYYSSVLATGFIAVLMADKQRERERERVSEIFSCWLCYT